MSTNIENFQKICDDFPHIKNLKYLTKCKYDNSRKIYLLGTYIIKSRRIQADLTQSLRYNSLKDEFNIIKKAQGINGIPKVIEYVTSNEYELLFLEYITGVVLEEIKMTFKQFMVIVYRLMKILIHLCRLGISHNDINPDNIILDINNSVTLIDFDQATLVTPFQAFLRQFLGINIGKGKVNLTIRTIFKKYLREKYPNGYRIIKKFYSKTLSNSDYSLPNLPENPSEKLQNVYRAFKIAQQSNASAPNQLIAYYEFKYENVIFPGERPWEDRWASLKKIRNYEDKSVLELGCNMGLLSVFLKKEMGVKLAVAIDHDENILKAARIIANVFEVDIIFKQLNFDLDKHWEKELEQYKFDICFCLNVIHWVNDKYRLFNFLSEFSEIIYEGHQNIENEIKMFKDLGFQKVDLIGLSERNRAILRCQK